MTTWTYVQGKASSSTGSATGATALTAAVTSGNVVFGGAVWSTDGAGNRLLLTDITDDKGNSLGSANGYQMTVYSWDGTQTLLCFMSVGLVTDGRQTITIHLSGIPSANFFAEVDEFTPPTGTTAISLDGTVTAIDDSTPRSSSTPFQSINSNVLIWGYSLLGNTPGSGFTAAFNDGTTFTEYRVQATPSNSNAIIWGTATKFFGGFGIAPVANTGWVPVQWAQVGTPINVGPNTITVSLVKPVTPGNIVIGGFGAFSALTSITDNLGGNYTADLIFLDSLNHGFWWSGGEITTAPQSFTIAGTSATAAATVVEFRAPPGFSGASLDGSPVDGTYNGGANITTLTTPAITTTHANSLVYAWISSGAVLGDIPTDGFSILNNPYLKNSDAYWVQATPGSVTSTWGFAAGNGIALFAIGVRESPPPINTPSGGSVSGISFRGLRGSGFMGW